MRSMKAANWFVAFLFLFTVQHIKIAEGVPLAAIVMMLFAVALSLRRLVVIDGQLVLLYAVIAVAAATSFVANSASSFMSLAYLLALTWPFIFAARPRDIARFSPPGELVAGFQKFMTLAVVLGVAQVALGDNFFSVRDLMPDAWLLEGFNTSNRMELGSLYIYRSNGFFFLEPSFFAQYLAFAILMEMRGRRNLATLAIMSLGMFVSLSGSGFVMLAIGLFGMAMRSSSAKNVVRTIMPVLVLCAIVVYFLPSLAERVTELNDEDKSGYWRFVMPVLYVYQSYSNSLAAMLVGLGPGISKNDVGATLMAYSSGIGKILYENGLLGAVPIIAIYYRFIMKSFPERWFAISMLIFILVVNCGVQEPVTLMVVMLFTLFATPRTATSRRAAASRPAIAGPELAS